ncbi:acyltransferase family protein [Pseudomonas cedrina]|uniref:acyltransferase family protein n=1 Tax=Pseudomonas cedrina TaxID=651740 RepID=UPI003EDA622C
MNDNREVLSLTGLRFFAALYVFVFHIQIRWPITEIDFIKNVINQGAIGMSIFFMLSGYLLMMNYVNAEGNTRRYLVNRFARIYPVYFVAGVVTLPWLGIHFSGNSPELLMNMLKVAFIFIANLFVIQAWFPQMFSFWNNGGSWSISVEVFCYSILPFMAKTIRDYPSKNLIYLIGACYAFSVMAGVSVKLFGGYGVPVFYAMPIFRLPEFIIGACVFILLSRHPLHKYFWLIHWASVALLICYLGIAGNWMPIYIGHNWIVIPVVAITLCALARGGGPIVWLLSRPLFVWYGKISYCFYSFQALIGLTLMSHHDKLIEIIPYLANGKLLIVSAFLVLTALSAFGYYLIEEPSRRLIKRHWTPKPSEFKQRAVYGAEST